MTKNDLTNLETLQEKIQEKIEQRECTFDERSEKWKESEKGELFQEKTNKLQEVLDNLEFTIESATTFLEL